MEQDRERQMIRTMNKYGLRITEQRKSLAKLFAEAPGYLTPKEVYDKMEMRHNGLSFDTVYRNLRVLHELGVLEQFLFEDGVKFRIACFAEKHHHHHLICLSCDRIYPFEFCPMKFVEHVPKHFKAVKHRFEIYGYCSNCAETDLATHRDIHAPAQIR